MASELKVLHYINQFFGGIGGEDANDLPVETREGALGPGRLLDQKLGDRGSVVATVIGGDNYFVEEEDESVGKVREALERFKPDLVVAGPAFDAGRYGMACALVCGAAGEMGIPAVTGMVDDNAGVLANGRDTYVVPTGDNPADMAEIIDRMMRLGLKLASGDELSHADVDDYIPHGLRRQIVREKPGAERAVDMALAMALGQPITPEIKVRQYDFVPAPAPIQNLAETTVALLTTAGIVPKGNPDGQGDGAGPRKWVSYNIDGVNALTLGEWESVHSGFKGYMYNSVNPNYALPLPALRALEALGVIKRIHSEFFSIVGGACPVTAAQNMGRDIAKRLVNDGVQAVILEST